MDDDPSSAALDFACGHRTYNDHNGTDFAILDRRVMASGVPVTAAADGVVARLRDGVADAGFKEGDRASLAGKNCGNGLVLQHGNGWETQYCHLRRGSIIVRAGQRVQAGQKMGLVGFSGMTEFPHVHLTVRHNGQSIDPFIGETRAQQCGPGEHPLWRADLQPVLKYEPFAIYHAGFADRRPSPDEVRAGDLDEIALSRTSALIMLWADIFGPAENDMLTMRIKGPDGAVLAEQTRQIKTTQAIHFTAIGRKRPDHDWPAGKYVGEIVLSRSSNTEGGPLDQRVVREAEIH